MTTLQTGTMVAVFALGTLLTRALPFILSPKKRPIPKFILYLGRVLPFAITAMLIVYCLRDTQWGLPPHGIPELLAILLTAALFLLTKKSLLAILGGTLFYILMVQVVFAG